MRLVQSIIYNLYKGTMEILVTWQEFWMLVGSGFGMVNFGLEVQLLVQLSNTFTVVMTVCAFPG